MNVSIVILPAKVRPDGTHKVRLSIAHNGKTRYITTRFIIPSDKNIRNGRIVGLGNASHINNELYKLIQKVEKAYDSIEDAECYSCPQLIEVIKSKIESKPMMSVGDISSEWLKLKSYQCSEGSYYVYEKAIKRFIEFKGESFLLSMLTTDIVYKYDKWLESEGLSDTTINIKMGALMQVVRFATKKKYINLSINPFDDYKQRKTNVRRLNFSVEKLRMFRDLELTKHTDVRARDMFMLSFYLCGMNLSDMLKQDFSKDVVEYRRNKTSSRTDNDIVTEFTIQPEARAIIDKYIDDKGYIRFSGIMSTKNVHNKLKGNIQGFRDIIGVDNLIMYSARKMFSQIAAELDIRESLITYCLGDSPSKSGIVARFYIKPTKKMADIAIRKVLDYVASDYTDTEEYLQHEYEQKNNGNTQ